MRHMRAGPNVGLLTLRINGAGKDFVALAAATVIEKGSLPRGNYSLFPLWQYDDQQPVPHRLTNLTEPFVGALQCAQDREVPADEAFRYTYAVLNSASYRTRYAEFLKIDFPRIPLTSNRELFRELCRLGARLVTLHLMEASDLAPITTYPVPGDNCVEKVRYTEPGQGGEQGRVWVNSTQHFEGVPPEVWQFHVGGYQVCAKWLKDRKGRQLTYDDLTHYQYVVAALAETIALMREIDAVIEAHGGWPLS
jgi:predicted helicase